MSYATGDDGQPLSWKEFRAHLLIEQNKGHEVLPMGEQCGDPCGHADKGCTGFVYRSRDGQPGCPGYETSEDQEDPQALGREKS